ncbi:hypothetical protein HOLleu_00738 [Holothuria leucospilota]|uniref:Uncharacterized protein n=1 Tax=Holothuria leucospilota TaxID=206669 RepID=A0A9Q1CPI4_HOLLE|nr:hypothetical protein HOLleu_00738 [Holothuria leucospilota]
MPAVFKRLWEGLHPGVEKNLKAGFRTTGLHPFNPQAVLTILPDSNEGERTEYVGRDLDDCLKSMLEEHRGQKGDEPKRKRGKKIMPGMQITPDDIPSTSRTTKKEVITNVQNAVLFDGYLGADWIQCIYCLGWVCGPCNEGSTDIQYCCTSCDE